MLESIKLLKVPSRIILRRGWKRKRLPSTAMVTSGLFIRFMITARPLFSGKKFKFENCNQRIFMKNIKDKEKES